MLSARYVIIEPKAKSKETLGEGAYGVVYKARDSHHRPGSPNEFVALKKIKVESENEGISSSTLREITLLSQLDHENVVKLMDVEMLNSDRMNLIFELMELDLRKYMDTCKVPPSLDLVKSYTAQILEGLSYCHSMGVMHRDLKPHNILVNHNGSLKIADFGLARTFLPSTRQLTIEVVTRWYRAPEILLGYSTYDCSVDLWSVGCILAEISNKKPLFPSDGEIDQIHKIFKLLGTPSPATHNWPELATMPHWRNTFPNWKIPGTAVAENALGVYSPGSVGSARGIALDQTFSPPTPQVSTSSSSTAGSASGYSHMDPQTRYWHRLFPNLDTDGVDLMRRLLVYNPQHRICALSALAHPFVRSQRAGVAAGRNLSRSNSANTATAVAANVFVTPPPVVPDRHSAGQVLTSASAAPTVPTTNNHRGSAVPAVAPSRKMNTVTEEDAAVIDVEEVLAAAEVVKPARNAAASASAATTASSSSAAPAVRAPALAPIAVLAPAPVPAASVETGRTDVFQPIGEDESPLNAPPHDDRRGNSVPGRVCADPDAVDAARASMHSILACSSHDSMDVDAEMGLPVGSGREASDFTAVVPASTSTSAAVPIAVARPIVLSLPVETAVAAVENAAFGTAAAESSSSSTQKQPQSAVKSSAQPKKKRKFNAAETSTAEYSASKTLRGTSESGSTTAVKQSGVRESLVEKVHSDAAATSSATETSVSSSGMTVAHTKGTAAEAVPETLPVAASAQKPKRKGANADVLMAEQYLEQQQLLALEGVADAGRATRRSRLSVGSTEGSAPPTTAAAKAPGSKAKKIPEPAQQPQPGEGRSLRTRRSV